ncbi:MAG: lipopolysaccharide heptosyltransferase I [Terriglobia bacterium]
MPTPPQRFLVIRLSSIGDIVHALPAVSALAESYPHTEITWAIEDRYAALLDGNPCVHRVIRIDTLGWRKRIFSARTLGEVTSAIRRLREERYDAVIDFQGLIKTGIMARLCRASRRIGYAKSGHREPGAGLFYTEEVALQDGMHVIEENLALAKNLGARPARWKFPLPRREKDERYIEAQLRAIGAQELIIVNPGGGWAAKRWSPENYASLIARMAPSQAEPIARPEPEHRTKTARAIILTGSPADESDIAAILRQAACEHAHYLPTTLSQYIALARRARLFVGGDTGPMHLAAALDVPVVAIMGPTDPRRNGPFSASDVALSNHGPVDHTRRAKDSQFLEGIPVDDVFAAVQKRLESIHAR